MDTPVPRRTLIEEITEPESPSAVTQAVEGLEFNSDDEFVFADGLEFKSTRPIRSIVVVEKETIFHLKFGLFGTNLHKNREAGEELERKIRVFEL